MRIDKIIALMIGIAIMALIVPVTNVFLYMVTLSTLIAVSFIGLYFNKRVYKVSIVNVDVSRKRYLSLLAIEFIIFVVLIIMIRLFLLFIPIGDKMLPIYWLAFFYLTKDIMFRSIGFMICKISYNYSDKFVHVKIICSNLFYFSIPFLSLFHYANQNRIDKNVSQYFYMLFFLLFCVDQFYLYFIDKKRSLINKMLKLEIYSI